jgi:hypothetical protein
MHKTADATDFFPLFRRFFLAQQPFSTSLPTSEVAHFPPGSTILKKLKIQSWRQGAGSTPATGTTTSEERISVPFPRFA